MKKRSFVIKLDASKGDQKFDANFYEDWDACLVLIGKESISCTSVLEKPRLDFFKLGRMMQPWKALSFYVISNMPITRIDAFFYK